MIGMSKAKPESKALPKRFYAAASVQQNADIFCITLDGKIIKTPRQKLLQTSSQQLATAIAAEWDVQGDVIDTDSMPLTRLLNLSLDRAAEDRAAWLSDIVNYGDTDLLYYREPPSDSQASRELQLLQQKYFTPILEWCRDTYGLHFLLTEGVMPVAQPPESLTTLGAVFATATDHELAGLAMMVPLLGSALLALAIWKGGVTLEEALIAARIDESVQAKYWGEDAEAAAKWAGKARDIRAAAFFLTCNT